MNKKPTGIFYLTDLSLTIQTERSVLGSFSFPKELVTDGEVIDQAGLVQFLKEKIVGIDKKIKIGVIILGSGLLYQRSVGKEEDLSKVREGLSSSVPFDKKFIAEKIIETTLKNYLLVTNKSFYQALISACKENKIAISAVLPLSLFSDQDIVDTIDEKIVKAILTKEELYEDGNFLENENISPESSVKAEVQEEKSDHEKMEPVLASTKNTYRITEVWNTTRLVLILGFLIALTVILGSLIYLQMNRFQLPGQVTQVTPTPQISPTSTEAPKETAKSDLKASVQNGTGTAGQAGKVKALLEGIEYTEIEIDNADSSDHEKTEVVFSSKVSEKQQKEIKDLLLESFSAVTTSIDPAASTDIVVITGAAK